MPKKNGVPSTALVVKAGSFVYNLGPTDGSRARTITVGEKFLHGNDLLVVEVLAVGEPMVARPPNLYGTQTRITTSSPVTSIAQA